MNVLEHIKIAGFTGLILGIFIGIIDIFARVMRGIFEWFEFYQTLAVSVLFFIILFLFIELIISLFKRTKNINRKSLYIPLSIFFIILFYGGIIINKYLPIQKTSMLQTSINLKWSILYLIFCFFVFLLLTKRKKLMIDFYNFLKNNKKIINNILFIVVIFIIISFFVDLYSINYTKNFTPEEKINSPNVLLIKIDTLRSDYTSVYNNQLNNTPNIEMLSKKAVVFNNAITASSWTLPSISSVMTGLYPKNHKANKITSHLDKNKTTLAEILEEKGYNTVGFVSGIFGKNQYGLGQGFINYKDRSDFFYSFSFDRFSIKNLIFTFSPKIHNYIFNIDYKISMEKTNKAIFKWLDEYKNEPFFMYVHNLDIHEESIGKKNKKDFPKKYKEEIIILDKEVGNLINKLKELNILNNTIIIITSDHGIELYDHEGFGSGLSLYEESIHVPLIIYYPKLEPKRIEKRIETMNIFSTILDMLKINQPKNIDSISLLPLIKNQDYKREYTFSELLKSAKSNIWKDEAISNNNWKLIKKINKTGEISFELYNLEEDPKEQNNIYNKQPEEANLLKEYLAKRI